MVRISISLIASLILLYVESLIVIKVFHYENGIYFGNYQQLMVVCILNFFLVFSILTQLMPWFIRINRLEMDEE